MADHLSLAPRTLGALAERGVVARTARGRWDQDATRLRYIEHLRKAAAGRGVGGEVDLAEERALLARTRREAAELALAKDRGTLLEYGAVKAAWAGILLQIRSQILDLPARLALQLEGRDAVEIERLLDHEIRECLLSLSRGGSTGTDTKGKRGARS
jgi:phage terminase Nu1 subunit (DNA packaging protein)